MKALQESADRNKELYKFEKPDANILEHFPNPLHLAPLAPEEFDGTVYDSSPSIEIRVPEFTSLCPITGQPDFATIVINYIPALRCVESKSLKLYLLGFRNYGAFHEQCVAEIANDLISLLKPKELTVKGEFTPRGGIPFHPSITYRRVV